MNKKGFIIPLLVIIILIAALVVGYLLVSKQEISIPPITNPEPQQVIENPALPPPPPADAETITTTNGKNIYHNTYLKFQLTLPNKDWYFMLNEPDDPHLYATEKCANSEWPECSALEIQNHDDSFPEGVDEVFNGHKTAGQNPVKLTNVIPGAIIVKSKGQGGMESWDFDYDVFFPAAKKRYLILTNDEKLEKSILPTFTLDTQAAEQTPAASISDQIKNELTPGHFKIAGLSFTLPKGWIAKDWSKDKIYTDNLNDGWELAKIQVPDPKYIVTIQMQVRKMRANDIVDPLPPDTKPIQTTNSGAKIYGDGCDNAACYRIIYNGNTYWVNLGQIESNEPPPPNAAEMGMGGWTPKTSAISADNGLIFLATIK